MVTAPGYRRVITHVFVDDDPYLDRDAVFAVKTPLITAFQRHEPGPAPDGRELDAPFWTLAFDLVLAPA
jgi:hydroxyquinol 1,2-dioxygenase